MTFATPATNLEDLDEGPQAVTYPARVGFSPDEDGQGGDPSGPPANHLPNATVFRETTTAIAAIPAAAEHHSPSQALDGINVGSPFSAFGNRSDAAHSSSTPNGGDGSTVASGGSYWRSSLYQPSTKWPLRTEEEARLFHHFVKHLGAWVRLPDDKSHTTVDLRTDSLLRSTAVRALPNTDHSAVLRRTDSLQVTRNSIFR